MRLLPLLLLFVATTAAQTNGSTGPPPATASATTGTLLYNPIYSDQLICANYRNRNGTFQFEKCPRYGHTGVFPFCVYLVVASTQTVPGHEVYGCAYGKDLPNECVENANYYFERATMRVRGQSYTGSGICCMDNYCNEVEEPVFTAVRLADKDSNDEHWHTLLPSVLASLVAFGGVFAILTGCLQKRHEKSVPRNEAARFLEDDIAGKRPYLKRIKLVKEIMTQSMNFKNLKAMQTAVKECLQGARYSQSTSSTYLGSRVSGSHGYGSHASSSHNLDSHPLDDHATSYEYKELVFSERCRVFQRDDKKPARVQRVWPTRQEHLAQMMIEHGPYRFDFDAVELGNLYDSMANLFGAEPTVLELEPDVHIYGNLEGSYGDLFRWMHKNGWPPKRKVLFLGGLTRDDEPYSLETITLIFAMKKLMPNSVYVLRGAAETYPMRLEEDRFPARISQCLQDALFRACAHLPLAARIGPVFCSYGGFPHTQKELLEVMQIKRPLFVVKKRTMAARLIFSKAQMVEGSIPGCRGRGFNGATRPDLTYQQHPSHPEEHITLFVRARNPNKDGFMFIGDSILSLWSAVEVPRENKGGASFHIDKDIVATLNQMVPYGFYKPEELEKTRKETRYEVDNISRKKKPADVSRKSLSKTTSVSKTRKKLSHTAPRSLA